MNTLACILGGKSSTPFLKSSDTPHYRRAASKPPMIDHRHLAYRVVVEETGEVVYEWKPERTKK
jgi:hypothetical protein